MPPHLSAATGPLKRGPIGCTARRVACAQARTSPYAQIFPTPSVAIGAGKPGLAVSWVTRWRLSRSIRAISAAATTGGSTRTRYPPARCPAAYRPAA